MIHPETNITMYNLVSAQFYLDHHQFFDVVENVVIMAIIPISTFVVVVVATSVTVVQLKRIILWRKGASASADGTEVKSCMPFFLSFSVLQRRLLKIKMRTRRFLLLPEEKGSKGSWETTSSSDEVIDVVAANCVFEAGARYTFAFAELNQQHYY